MRKLKSGKFLIEPTVRSSLLGLWDFLDTNPDSRGYQETTEEFMQPIRVIMEKMRKNEPLTLDEVDRLVDWRQPKGTYRADPDGGTAYLKFIKQFCELKRNEQTTN